MTLKTIFKNIADAIRSKTGKTDTMKPTEMASEISSISGGGDGGGGGNALTAADLVNPTPVKFTVKYSDSRSETADINLTLLPSDVDTFQTFFKDFESTSSSSYLYTTYKNKKVFPATTDYTFLGSSDHTANSEYILIPLEEIFENLHLNPAELDYWDLNYDEPLYNRVNAYINFNSEYTLINDYGYLYNKQTNSYINSNDTVYVYDLMNCEMQKAKTFKVDSSNWYDSSLGFETGYMSPYDGSTFSNLIEAYNYIETSDDYYSGMFSYLTDYNGYIAYDYDTDYLPENGIYYLTLNGQRVLSSDVPVEGATYGIEFEPRY